MKIKRLIFPATWALAGAAVMFFIMQAGTPRPVDAPSWFYEPSPAELALDKIIDEVDFKDTTLDEIAKVLTQKSGVTIQPDWAALETAGIGKGNTLTVRVRSATLEQILDLVRSEGPYVRADGLFVVWTEGLGYYLDHSGICISTSTEEAGRTLTRIYDVRDLIRVNPASTKARVHSIGAIGWPPGYTDSECINSLRDYLTSTISQESWRENGGTGGEVEAFQNLLIITQTQSNHRKIRKELYALRHPERLANAAKQKATP